MPVLSLPPYTALEDAAAVLMAKTQDEPTRKATAKALYHLSNNINVVTMGATLLVPSSKSLHVIYRVSTTGCTCEAGRAGRVCWHSQVAPIIEQANTYRVTLPTPKRTYTPEQAARIDAEMAELFTN